MTGRHTEHEETKPGVSRRAFLQTTGVGAAASIAACTRLPVQHAIPYLVPPEEIVPGEAVWYASTCTACSAACGLMVKTREGRPVKLEGLEGHAHSRGGLCAVGQADLRGLYDADRLQAPRVGGAKSTWEALDAHVAETLAAVKASGKKVAVLTTPLTGPTARATVAAFLAAHDESGGLLVEYDPHPEASSAVREAYAALDGRALAPSLVPEEADLLVVLGADPLGAGLDTSAFTAGWAARRRAGAEHGAQVHIQIEASLTLTGGAADERWQATAAERSAVAAHLLQAVHADAKLPDLPALPRKLAERVTRLVGMLKAHPGKSLVVSGSDRIAEQLAVALLNRALGNEGHTLLPADPQLIGQGKDADVLALLGGMKSGDVGALFVLHLDPVDQLPQGAEVAESLKAMPLSVALTDRPTATAAACGVVAAAHHGLESWGDFQPRGHVASFAQPAVRPLFDTRQALGSLLVWAGAEETDYRLTLASQWQGASEPPATQTTFQRWVAAGSLPAATAALRAPSDGGGSPTMPPADHVLWGTLRTAVAAAATPGPALEVDLISTVSFRDGTRSFIPWLRELPGPLSRVSWTAVAQIAPRTAHDMGIKDGDHISVGVGGQTLSLPARVTPGQHPRVIGVPVGFGRRDGDEENAELNAYRLAQWTDGRLATRGLAGELKKVAGATVLPLMQLTLTRQNRDIVHQVPTPTSEPRIAHHGPLLSLWQERATSETRWTMSVDLDACTGCSACIISCQVENNIPVVGPGDIADHRDMYWLRMDRYYDGDIEDPDVLFEPMLCQQCSHAPCETVCPVLATMHSDDGINQQAYNRCVGTRYCANNCPYKVRRFNWFDKQPTEPLERLVLNPDVVMRMQGVMEKCTFCVQRIQETRIAHKNGDTGFPAAQTACQQSCPAGAISFGNGIDPASAVARQAANPRAFRVLAETGVDPSIAYLAKVRTRPGGVGGEHDSGAGGHAGATHDAQGGGHGEGS